MIIKYTPLVTVTFLAWMFFSCNPEKALIRKENKALGIVEGSRRVFPIAGADWLTIHPCVITTPRPDSIVTRIDTILKEKKIFVPFKTTEYRARMIDTIVDNVSIYADSNGIVIKNLNDAIIKTNTVYKTIVDQTLVNMQRDTINSLREQKANLLGQVGAKDAAYKEQASSQKKDNRFWIFMFISAVVAGVASHFIRSKIKL